MAKQASPNDGVDLNPSRYSETRAPQFVGGDIDSLTGNVVPSSASTAAKGTPAAASSASSTLDPLVNDSGTVSSPSQGDGSLPSVSQPTTRLATLDAGSLTSGLPSFQATPTPAAPQVSAPSISSLAGQTALTAGAGLLGKAASSLFSSGGSGGKNNGNPLDNTGGGTGNGGGTPGNSGSSSTDESGFIGAFNPPPAPTPAPAPAQQDYSQPAYTPPEPAPEPAPSYQPPAQTYQSSYQEPQSYYDPGGWGDYGGFFDN